MADQEVRITRNVLVPIDFSICCYNAFRYGLHLAEATGRNLLLVHYAKNHFLTQADDYKAALTNRMELFVQPANHLRDFDFEELPARVEINFEGDSVKNPVESIIERAERPDVDLVVMGSKSSAKKVETWYGSTSIRVSSTCDRPVFLVPPKAEFTPFERIVVANSATVASPHALWQIEELAELYQSKIHFLHVDNPNHEEATRFTPQQLMEELTGKESKVNYPFVVTTVIDNDISHGILEHAQEIDAQLLIVVNDLAQTDGRVFHQTLTQDVTLRSPLPLLVIHTEKKK